jgi:hypothetical protein
MRQVHPSGLVRLLDHVADEDHLGPALQVRPCGGSTSRQGRDMLPPSLPQSPVSRLSPWRHPRGATLPHAATSVQQQRKPCVAGLQAAPLLRAVHQITPRCGLWDAWHRPRRCWPCLTNAPLHDIPDDAVLIEDWGTVNVTVSLVMTLCVGSASSISTFGPGSRPTRITVPPLASAKCHETVKIQGAVTPQTRRPPTR